jgi:hypothetical protein
MHMMTGRAGFVFPHAWTCTRCHNSHASSEGFLSNPHFYCVPAKSPMIRFFNFCSQQVVRFKSSILASFPTGATFFSQDDARVPQQHLLSLRPDKIPTDQPFYFQFSTGFAFQKQHPYSILDVNHFFRPAATMRTKYWNRTRSRAAGEPEGPSCAPDGGQNAGIYRVRVCTRRVGSQFKGV